MQESSVDNSSTKFFLGFIGIISFGFFILMAVGFFQTEMAPNKNISSVENSAQE
jgi:hypothetical protein